MAMVSWPPLTARRVGSAALGQSPTRCGLLNIELRAGLHTGECELIGEDISGMVVNIGARIGALAASNEVVVSSTVKDLVVGSGISFSDWGAHELKGVPGDWRLFAVEEVEARSGGQLAPDTRRHRLSDRAATGAARKAPRLAQRVIGWRADR